MSAKNQGLDFAIWANGDVTDFKDDYVEGKIVIALDGGIKSLGEWGVTPHYLLGDFDSIEDKEIKSFKKRGVKIIEAQDQNFTDLEKAIMFADQFSEGVNSIEILNFQGERLDHSFGTLIFLKKYFKKERSLRMRTMEQTGEYLPVGDYQFRGEIDSKVGILPFLESMISTRGLKYDVEGYQMSFLNNVSIGNSFAEKKFELQVLSGGVLLFSGA